MINAIVRLSIERRYLILSLMLALVGIGVWSYQQLPIDAVPDITNVQVQINTEAAGYSPLEAEQRITFPVETALYGLPRLSIPAPFRGMGCHRSRWCLRRARTFITPAT